MVKWQKKTMTMFLPVSPVGIVREQPQEFKEGAFCFYFFQVTVPGVVALGGLSLVSVCGLLVTVTSLVAAPGPSAQAQ